MGTINVYQIRMNFIQCLNFKGSSKLSSGLEGYARDCLAENTWLKEQHIGSKKTYTNDARDCKQK